MHHLSFTQPTDFLQERNFSQKIDATFDFVRAHFRPLLRTMAIIVLPLALLTGIGSGLLQGRMLEMMQGIRMGGGAPMLFGFMTAPSYWLTILASLVLLVLLQLTVYSYVLVSMQRPDPAVPVTVAEVWALVRRRFLGMAGSMLGLGILFVVSAMAFSMIIGFIGAGLAAISSSSVFLLVGLGIYGVIGYVGVTLSLFFVIWMRERRGFFGSIGRCFQLIKGRWWSTFALLTMMVLLSFMFLIIILSVLGLVAWPLASMGKLTAADLQGPVLRVLLIVVTSLQTLGMLATYPLLFIAICFQYFSLVERREGEGLQLLVAAIGQEAPAAAPSALRPDDEGEY